MMPQAMQYHLVTYQTSLLVETVVCSVIIQTKHTARMRLHVTIINLVWHSRSN